MIIFDRKIDDNLHNLLNNGIINEFADRATLWESIGRVKVIQGFLKDANAKFDSAEAECIASQREGTLLPYFLFQVIRGRLMMVSKTEVRDRNLDQAKDLALEAFRIARVHKNARYWNQIKELVNQLGIATHFRDELSYPLTRSLNEKS